MESKASENEYLHDEREQSEDNENSGIYPLMD